MMKRSKSGFGHQATEHDQHYFHWLEETERSIESARRVLRGGDCHAGVESATQAFEEYGRASGHRNAVSPIVRDRTQQRWQKAGTALNFLRQGLKRCMD